MPELPEVETTRKGIQPKVEGQTIQKIIIRNGKLRWPVEQNLVKKLPGLVILNVKRRAKYLLLETAQGHLIIHLGMSGNLRVLPQQEPAIKHDHIDLILGNGFLLRYHDPRRFGSWLWTDQPLQEHALLKALGPEPLTDSFNADYLFQKLQGRKTAIKTFIMNNHIVVGVGNIYANESLFLSGIHPTRSAQSLTLKETTQLTGHIKAVLSAAIEQGGTTLKDFLTPDGKPGYFEQKLNVYGKEGLPCPLCDSAVEKNVLNQRAAYFCSNCQK